MSSLDPNARTTSAIADTRYNDPGIALIPKRSPSWPAQKYITANHRRAAQRVAAACHWRPKPATDEEKCSSVLSPAGPVQNSKENPVLGQFDLDGRACDLFDA